MNTGTWVVLGEKVAGTSHLVRSTPCQDAFAFRTFGRAHEWLAVAVADGAGSADRSDIGAAVTCEVMLRYAEAWQDLADTDGDSALALFSEARGAVFAEAERLGVHPRALACTALLAVVGPARAIFGQIGDGAIVFRDGPEYRTAFWPQPGEYANETDFLTDERFVDAFEFTTTETQVSELAVFSDGLQRLVLDFELRAPHPRFFGPMFGTLLNAEEPATLPAALRAFLDSPRVNEHTDDDKTLVLAVRKP